jgi:hypothetical protein
VDEQPETAAGAVRAIVKTLQALKNDVGLATKVAEKLFPAKEAGLIATLIERDLPFYDASLYEENVAGMNSFAKAAGLLDGDAVPFEDIVATQFRDLWKG